jgi:hypothetical protein
VARDSFYVVQLVETAFLSGTLPWADSLLVLTQSVALVCGSSSRFHCPESQVQTRAETQFAEDVADMRLNGALGED